MRPTLIAAALVAALIALPPARALAQAPDSTASAAATGPASSDTTGPVLSLNEAVSLALKNNPDHLTTVDARHAASAQRRAAYGAFLPSFSANLRGSLQGAGNTPFNGVVSQQFNVPSSIYQSQYGLALTYNINAATFINPKLQSANVRAADADIVGSAQVVRTTVTQDYLTALQDLAKAGLQDSLVVQDAISLEFAKAKMAVGSGTQLDVSQAEVTLGKDKVAALTAHNQAEIDKLTLFQEMGVPQPPNVQLTTHFDVVQPTFSLDSLLDVARAQNPALNAFRARDRAAGLQVRTQEGQYLPTLQLQASWGGFTSQLSNSDAAVAQQQGFAQGNQLACFTEDSIRVGAGLPAKDCSSIFPLSPGEIAAVRAQNSQFPFNFTKLPFQLSAFISLPIFDGFQREQQIEQAKATRNKATYAEKKQELQLTADVTSAYLTLVADAQAVTYQEQNAAAATEQLKLAEEKYRVGSATYLDLATARQQYSQVETDRINAIYAYHAAFAKLENAVGRPLR